MLAAQRCLRLRCTPCRTLRSSLYFRAFSRSAALREIRELVQLPPRIRPQFHETPSHDLVALQWPSAPRNILCICKNDPVVREAVIEYTTHLHDTYPDVNLIFESYIAQDIQRHVSRPVYTFDDTQTVALREKVDLTSTLGGDGTILHAAAMFATAVNVPPILSFSMGTLGFLGEWKFNEYKRAFREVYCSMAQSTPLNGPPIDSTTPLDNKSTINAASSMSRASRVLIRNRLRVGLFDKSGARLSYGAPFANAQGEDDVFALNEVLLHRGALPHLSHITILIGLPPHQRILTTAIADGFLVSTPTGSTAYSLSSGGSIVHPLVSSILLTPICPRSLSFRPLVLPANTPIVLRIEPTNRAKEIEVSIDGERRPHGLGAGMEVRVIGEEVRTPGAPGSRDWRGGVPSIVRSSTSDNGEGHWVGGLNSLLKFNYPFGEDD